MNYQKKYLKYKKKYNNLKKLIGGAGFGITDPSGNIYTISSKEFKKYKKMNVNELYNYLKEGNRLTEYDSRLDKNSFKLVAKMKNFEEDIDEGSTEKLIDLYNRIAGIIRKKARLYFKIVSLDELPPFEFDSSESKEESATAESPEFRLVDIDKSLSDIERAKANSLRTLEEDDRRREAEGEDKESASLECTLKPIEIEPLSDEFLESARSSVREESLTVANRILSSILSLGLRAHLGTVSADGVLGKYRKLFVYGYGKSVTADKILNSIMTSLFTVAERPSNTGENNFKNITISKDGLEKRMSHSLFCIFKVKNLRKFYNYLNEKCGGTNDYPRTNSIDEINVTCIPPELIRNDRSDLVETEIYYGKSLLGLASGYPVGDRSYVKIKETGDPGGKANIIEGVSMRIRDDPEISPGDKLIAERMSIPLDKVNKLLFEGPDYYSPLVNAISDCSNEYVFSHIVRIPVPDGEYDPEYETSS